MMDDLREARLVTAAAASGLVAAARAVSRAADLLLSFVVVRRRGPALGYSSVPPRPAEVARLMAAVVAGSLALLAVVLLCDEVGRRLVTETLSLAKK